MDKNSRRIVTISGDLGSGKSTVARMLAQKLGWQYYSTGMAQREIAIKMGVTTVELNQLALSDKSIDQMIDAVFQNPPWGRKPCVVDSRLAFHFLPRSFKVCLTVKPEVAAQRILNDQTRTGERKYKTLKQALIACQKRRKLELSRFIENYNLDITNPDNFDYVLDTSELSPLQTCNRILKALKQS